MLYGPFGREIKKFLCDTCMHLNTNLWRQGSGRLGEECGVGGCGVGCQAMCSPESLTAERSRQYLLLQKGHKETQMSRWKASLLTQSGSKVFGITTVQMEKSSIMTFSTQQPSEQFF